MHLKNFLEMLDSQRIVYKKRYWSASDHTEIAIPVAQNEGYLCFDFDGKGEFDCLWERSFDYDDERED